MTLEEAIRYNGATLNEMECQLLHHRASALRLGIEALKRLARNRDSRYRYGTAPLLGETKE